MDHSSGAQNLEPETRNPEPEIRKPKPESRKQAFRLLKDAKGVEGAAVSVPPHPLERRGNSLIAIQDFDLKAKARTWTCLSYVCRVCSTAAQP